MDAKELKTRFNLVLKLLKNPNDWKSYGCFNVGCVFPFSERFLIALVCVKIYFARDKREYGQRMHNLHIAVLDNFGY